MAKSLRSKRERKLRRVKRVRYGKKELERLKNMIGIKDTTTELSDTDPSSSARQMILLSEPSTSVQTMEMTTELSDTVVEGEDTPVLRDTPEFYQRLTEIIWEKEGPAKDTTYHSVIVQCS
uniref:Uncharacterized protein n=1 Tax=Cacopsylla melanoneura TaxID=428564 RepID=A0A8D8X442_9HEMI